MPTTEPTYGWPLPELSDPPDVPGDLAALAAAIADLLTTKKYTSANGDVIVYTNGRVFTITGQITSAHNAYEALPAGLPQWVIKSLDTRVARTLGHFYGSSGTPDYTDSYATIFIDATGVRWFRPGRTLGAGENVRFTVTAVAGP